MKKLLITLPLLFCSCSALDKALGVGGSTEPDRTEETISAVEDAAAPLAVLIPGGTVLLGGLGLLARAYVRKRKAAKAA